jgi:hypothetical protein
MKNFHKLLKGEHILGLTNVHFEKDRVCSACQAGKQVGTHHPHKNIMTTDRPLELLSHPVLEGKPNANHVRARISYSRTQQLHNMDIITQCSNSIKREIIVDYIIRLRRPYSPYNKSKCGKET